MVYEIQHADVMFTSRTSKSTCTRLLAPPSSIHFVNASTPTHTALSLQAPKSTKGKVLANPTAPVSKGRRMSTIVLPLNEPVQPPVDVSGMKQLCGEDVSVINGSICSGSSMANELPPSK